MIDLDRIIMVAIRPMRAEFNACTFTVMVPMSTASPGRVR